MSEIVPRSKPEHELMERTTAGSLLGIEILVGPETVSIVPGRLVNRRNRNILLSFLLIPIVGVFLAIQEYAHTKTEEWVLMAIAAAFIAFIAGIVFLATWHRAKMIGPLLVYEKVEGAVVLPRENQRYARDQIEHLQVLTVPGKGNQLMMTFTEVNLITRTPQGRARLSVLGNINEPGYIDTELQLFVAETEIPIFQYVARKKQGVEYVEIADLRAG